MDDPMKDAEAAVPVGDSPGLPTAKEAAAPIAEAPKRKTNRHRQSRTIFRIELPHLAEKLTRGVPYSSASFSATVSDSLRFRVVLQPRLNPAELSQGDQKLASEYARISLELEHFKKAGDESDEIKVDYHLCLVDRHLNEVFGKQGSVTLAPAIFWEGESLKVARSSLLDPAFELLTSPEQQPSSSVSSSLSSVKTAHNACKKAKTDVEKGQDEKTKEEDYLKGSLIVMVGIRVHSSSHTVAHNIFETCEAFRKLFDSGNAGDLEIKLKGKSFMVHKAIVCARSPGFAKLIDEHLKSQKADSKPQAIVLDRQPDCGIITEATLQQVLHFIYCGTFKDHETLSMRKISEILYLDTKFPVNDMKRWCTDRLTQSLSMSTAVSVLRVASYYRLEAIVEAALQLLATHCHQIDEPMWRAVEQAKQHSQGPPYTLRLFRKLTTERHRPAADLANDIQRVRIERVRVEPMNEDEDGNIIGYAARAMRANVSVAEAAGERNHLNQGQQQQQPGAAMVINRVPENPIAARLAPAAHAIQAPQPRANVPVMRVQVNIAHGNANANIANVAPGIAQILPQRLLANVERLVQQRATIQETIQHIIQLQQEIQQVLPQLQVQFQLQQAEQQIHNHNPLQPEQNQNRPPIIPPIPPAEGVQRVNLALNHQGVLIPLPLLVNAAGDAPIRLMPMINQALAQYRGQQEAAAAAAAAAPREAVAAAAIVAALAAAAYHQQHPQQNPQHPAGHAHHHHHHHHPGDHGLQPAVAAAAAPADRREDIPQNANMGNANIWLEALGYLPRQNPDNPPAEEAAAADDDADESDDEELEELEQLDGVNLNEN